MNRDEQWLPGRTVADRYRLGLWLGRGSMGQVFEAVDLVEQRVVAIKALLASMRGREDLERRLRREGATAERVQHRGVVPILDTGEHEGCPYIVMERLHGEDLSMRFARAGKLDAAQVAQLATELAATLAAAHEAGVIHRDLKPANVFLHEEPDAPHALVRVLDFGIAKVNDPQMSHITVENHVVGTVPYMAPEQLRYADSVSPQLDIYSLGAVLYEALAGVRAFPMRGPELTLRVRRGQREPISRHAPQAPPQLLAIIERAMSVDRTARYQRAADMLSELAGCPKAPLPKTPGDDPPAAGKDEANARIDPTTRRDRPDS